MNKIVIIAVLAAASLMPHYASAALINCGGTDTNGNPQNECTICDIFRLINNCVDYFVKTMIPLAAIMIVVYAGFKMIINQGNSEVAKQSRDIMLATAIGLVVVFASYAVVGAILHNFGVVKYGGGIVGALDWEPKCSD